MLIDTQRILMFSGDTLDDAMAMLRAQIEELPLTARVTSLTSGCDQGAFSGMAVVELIPEVESVAPAVDSGNVSYLPAAEGLPEEI